VSTPVAAPVNTPCTPPSVTLTADSTTITRGQNSTLIWQAFNAASLRIEPEVGAVALSGNRQVTPQNSVTYTATATSPCGTQSGVARITVNEQVATVIPPQPPAVIDVRPPQPPVTPPTPPQPPRGTPPTPTPTPVVQPRDPSFGESMLNILFDYDKAELRADQMAQLQADATWLKNHPNVRVIIEGHADERGNQEYNLALGVRRANTIVQFLTAQGVTESRIRSISYGKERPLCKDASPDEGCHQRNRRAAFTEAR
jgi:peptidoglycan-associated lipoprotein